MPDSGKILFLESLDSPLEQSAVHPDRLGEKAPNPSDTLATLVHIIRECGQDPVTQLAGFLMTDDPTYLPDSCHARLLADRIGRDKLLETLIELYLDKSGLLAIPDSV